MMPLILLIGVCSELSLAWSPAHAAMSIVPDAITPASEMIAVLPSTLPVDTGPMLCENAFDPRCTIQSSGLPLHSTWQPKHAPDFLWLVSLPAYARAARTVAFIYAGQALAGFHPRPERPPRGQA